MTAAELANLIAMMRERPAPERPTVEFMRERMNRLIPYLPTPSDASLRPVDADGVPCEWVAAPGAAADRCILYLHGGGYVIGSIATHRTLGYNLSQAAGAQVLMVDYRLAPEHRFPAAVDDAVAVWRWLLRQGAKPARAAIAGDSAGGGLALATLLRLREEGDPSPACGYCLSPWTDLAITGESIKTNAASDPSVREDVIRWMADLYLNGADPRTAQASPLYANLKGLPPLLVQVGSIEILLDDSGRLAERARAAGVEVEYEIWPGMPHVWQLYAPMLSEGRDALAKAGAFIRRRTDG